MAGTDDRKFRIERTMPLLAIAIASLPAGWHVSPWFDPIFFLLRPFIVAMTFASPQLTLCVTSLVVSILAVIVAGVPAAIYERIAGARTSTTTSLLIWLAGTVLLAVPAIISWWATRDL